ncbi:hypothetical protein BDV28DRAFT_127861 [Aspergillus coremiiformis]|uniref:Zn(2)-C6 fungal-type domain-containing protein n=1 Tax=Aspergillus coremiiformis TaxID=138285 RepID=A0A5N6ZEH5_9EURO|nr:hypothetical protein BDV28DRAFT_127861 [Aspergillus coremiiformis]
MATPAAPVVPTALKRRRGGGTKVRTGCRTCRARHIKCDEAPEACKNCTSTGRKCDGYDLYRLPIRHKDAPGLRLELPPMRRKMTSDESRCFSYFQHCIVPFIEFFDSPVWEMLVLQMSESERAVHHAVVALSAIHRAIDSTDQLRLTGDNETWRRFGIEQLGRSYAVLSRRHVSNDPQLGMVTLLCCLMFILSEFLLNQYDFAFAHLENGIRILKNYGYPQSDIHSVQHSLATMFNQLEIMSTPVYATRRVLDEDDLDLDQPLANLPPFQTLQEARSAFNVANTAMFHLVTDITGLSNEAFAMNYASLCRRQTSICSYTDQFEAQFRYFYKTKYSQLSPRAQRSAELLRIAQASLPLPLIACLQRQNIHSYTKDFKDLLSLIETFLSKFPERPTVVIDSGVITPLFAVAFGSPSYDDRRQAIKLLQAWPHREGPLQSTTIAQLALDRLRVQQGLTDTNAAIDHPVTAVVRSSPHRIFATRKEHQQATGCCRGMFK